MLIFWLWASLMVAVALALLVPSLLGRQGAGDGPVTDFGVALFRDRLAILETERHEGELAENDFQEARRELERELLAEADEAPPQPVRRAPLAGRRNTGIGDDRSGYPLTPSRVPARPAPF